MNMSSTGEDSSLLQNSGVQNYGYVTVAHAEAASPKESRSSLNPNKGNEVSHAFWSIYS